MSNNNTHFVDQIAPIKEEELLNSQEKSIESEVASKPNHRQEFLSNKIKSIAIDQNAICIQEFSQKQLQNKQTKLENTNQQQDLSNIPDNVSFGRVSPQSDYRSINPPLAKVSQINFEGIPFPTKFVVSKALMNPIPAPQLNLQKLAQIQQLQQPIKSSKFNEFPIIKECQVPRKRGSLTHRNFDENLYSFQQQKVSLSDQNQHNGNNNSNAQYNSSPLSQLKPNAYRIKQELNNSCIASDFTESYNKISYKRMSDFGQNLFCNNTHQIANLQQKKETKDNLNKINLQNSSIMNKFGKPILNKQHPLLQIAQQQEKKYNQEISLIQKQANSNNVCNSSRIVPYKKSYLMNNRSLHNSPRAFEHNYDNDQEIKEVNNLSQQKERTPLIQLMNSQNNSIELDCSLEKDINISNRQHLKHLDHKSIAKKIHVYKRYINKLEDLLQECKQEDKKKILSEQKYKTNISNPPSSNFQIESQIFKQNRSIFFEKVRPTTSVTVSRNNSQNQNIYLSEGLNSFQESNIAFVSNPAFISNSVMVSSTPIKNPPNSSEYILPKNSVLLHGLDLERNEFNFNQKQPQEILQKYSYVPLKNTKNAIENIIQQRQLLKRELNNSVIQMASQLEENNSRLNKSIDFIYTNKSKSSNKLENKPLNQVKVQKEIQKNPPQILDQKKLSRNQIESPAERNQLRKTSIKNDILAQEKTIQNEKNLELMFRKMSLLEKTASFAMYS